MPCRFYGIQNSNHGRVMIFAGGIPLRRNGSVVPASASAASSGKQDQAVATAGASATAHDDMAAKVTQPGRSEDGRRRIVRHGNLPVRSYSLQQG
jgi:hypothetical protein